MREPKFSDAPCYGKEFDADSRVCQICLAHKSCPIKYYRAVAGRKRRVAAPRQPVPPGGLAHLKDARSGAPSDDHIGLKPSRTEHLFLTPGHPRTAEYSESRYG